MKSTAEISFALVLAALATACAGSPDEPSGSSSPGVKEVTAQTAQPTPQALGSTGSGPAQATAAARSVLKNWLAAIPRNHLANYGFADEAEIAAATLGDPVPLQVLRPERAAPTENDPNAYVEPVVSQYLVPIMVRQQPRVFLRTRTINGRMLVDGLGDAAVATQLEIALTRWPPSSGFRLRFARRDGGVTFLLVDTATMTRIVPLESAARLFHFTTPPLDEVQLSELPPAGELMAKVRINPGPSAQAGNSRSADGEK